MKKKKADLHRIFADLQGEKADLQRTFADLQRKKQTRFAFLQT
ncbi:MAG: hypothetical protein ACXWG7_00225 [Chthoniobacterales bacterium]